jgi:hypothetical protein
MVVNLIAEKILGNVRRIDRIKEVFPEPLHGAATETIFIN